MAALKKIVTSRRIWWAAGCLYLAAITLRALHVDETGRLLAAPVPVWADWPAHFMMASAMIERGFGLWQTPFGGSPFLIFAPFHYPFLTNALSALLVTCGVPFWSAFTIPSLLFVCAGFVLLSLFHEKALGSLRATAFAGLIFFFNGGIGVLWLLQDIFSGKLAAQTLLLPPHLATLRPHDPLVWDSVLRTLFLPQRSLQLGFVLGIGALILLWNAMTTISARTRRWWGAGMLVGLLPVAHLHSFAAVGLITGCWAAGDILLHRVSWRQRALLWARFFGALGGLSLLLIVKFNLLSFGASVARFEPGWYAGPSLGDWIVFWGKNWGLVPVLALAGFWLEHRRLLIFAVPFAILFAIMNLFVLQPWIWDNTKILLWVSVGASALAGLAISRVWDRTRIVAIILLVATVLSGFIEAARLIHPKGERHELYSREALDLAAWIRNETPTESVWLTSPHHGNWVIELTGRQTLMAYEGWLWSHGYAYGQVKQDLESLMKDPETENLLSKYGITHACVGPMEVKMGADRERFLKTFRVIKEAGGFQIFERVRSTHPKSRASE